MIRSRGRQTAGFSLIEVLIALVVLAFGLLGLALLQTVNLRYTQSANQRTQAVNLAGQMLDMIRSNRTERTVYYMDLADMSGVPVSACGIGVAMGAAINVARWQCDVRKTLGDDAGVFVGPNATNPALTDVTVSWQEVTANPLDRDGEITLSSQL